jgi:hypothetical protein
MRRRSHTHAARITTELRCRPIPARRRFRKLYGRAEMAQRSALSDGFRCDAIELLRREVEIGRNVISTWR